MGRPWWIVLRVVVMLEPEPAELVLVSDLSRPASCCDGRSADVNFTWLSERNRSVERPALRSGESAGAG